MTRHDTLFSLRYAARVLERHARLWRRIDAAVRLAGLLAGSSAFAALMAESRGFTLVFGVVFAVLQAVEFALRPAEQAAQSIAQRRPYAALAARSEAMDDAGLKAAYLQLHAEDDVIVPESIRTLAYNDVVLEKGCDPAHLNPLDRWQRFVAFLA